MKQKIDLHIVFLAVLLMALAVSCATSKKVKTLQRDLVTAKMAPTEFKADTSAVHNTIIEDEPITILSKDNKEQDLVAYRDSDGEVFAEDVLDEVIVESTFKNVAERNGEVDLYFQITVPPALQDSKWQLRFYPTLEILGEKEKMEQVFITGSKYRKAQLRGYEQYDRFVSRIVADSTAFIDVDRLELFLKRNIPEIYAFKGDTSVVSDEAFMSYYGVSEQQAVEHYTLKLSKKRNEYRKSRRAKMFAKYVKVPILKDGVRLDTVIVNDNNDITYTYVQTVKTRPGLKKAQISMAADLYEEAKVVYSTPKIGPLDYFISSISSFVDSDIVHYIVEVIERRATDNKEYKLGFNKGKTDLDPKLFNNEEEIGKVKKHLASLIDNMEYDLDSIIVSAAASPEGTAAINRRLSQGRSVSIVDYFKRYVKVYQDSVNRAAALAAEEDVVMEINADSLFVDFDIEKEEAAKPVEISFTPHTIGEDWEKLRDLIFRDTIIPEADKDKFFEMFSVKDVDQREQKMRSVRSYNYMREQLYPELRSVSFRFYMHRKGMIKDTVHTTKVDSTYIEGVQALKDMNYPKADSILSRYKDYNTAVLYTSTKKNISALMILETLERTDKICYLMAVISAREGKIQDAVRYYMDACRMNTSYIHRGNLDPEISDLIKKYKLHDILYKEQEEEEMLLYGY